MPKICCFTGHRKIANEDIVLLPELLSKGIERLVAQDVFVFRAGGAIGFDTVAALSVLDKKREHPEISLELVLPCKNQSDGWSDRDKAVYNYVLERADKISYVSESYYKGCMWARNRRLVEGSSVCVAFCTSDKGGTAYTVNYAKEKGVRVINLYEVIQKSR